MRLGRPGPAVRYERDQPGELIYIDIKKLGRFERVGHRITGDRTGKSKSHGIGWRRKLTDSYQPSRPEQEHPVQARH